MKRRKKKFSEYRLLGIYHYPLKPFSNNDLAQRQVFFPKKIS